MAVTNTRVVGVRNLNLAVEVFVVEEARATQAHSKQTRKVAHKPLWLEECRPKAARVVVRDKAARSAQCLPEGSTRPEQRRARILHHPVNPKFEAQIDDINHEPKETSP